MGIVWHHLHTLISNYIQINNSVKRLCYIHMIVSSDFPLLPAFPVLLLLSNSAHGSGAKKKGCS